MVTWANKFLFVPFSLLLYTLTGICTLARSGILVNLNQLDTQETLQPFEG